MDRHSETIWEDGSGEDGENFCCRTTFFLSALARSRPGHASGGKASSASLRSDKHLVLLSLHLHLSLSLL